jgi:hypothetical protein
MAKAPRRTKTKRSARGGPDSPEKALAAALSAPVGKPSALLETRVIYCGDCLEQAVLRPMRMACLRLESS